MAKGKRHKKTNIDLQSTTQNVELKIEQYEHDKRPEVTHIRKYPKMSYLSICIYYGIARHHERFEI